MSCQTSRGAENVLKANFGSAIEIIYNMLDRRAEDKALPLAKEKKIAVIVRVPLASGFLSGKWKSNLPRFPSGDHRGFLPKEDVEWRLEQARQLAFLAELPGGMATSALRFCLSHPAVTTVIPGMRNPNQVECNVEAARLGSLPKSVLEKIHQAVPTTFSGWTKK